MLRAVIGVPATRTIRDIPTEVRLGPADGMPDECALSLDKSRSSDEPTSCRGAAGSDPSECARSARLSRCPPAADDVSPGPGRGQTSCQVVPHPAPPTLLPPNRSGYVFEGDTRVHWVFGAFDSPRATDDFGPPREVGPTTVRGRPARWLYAPDTGGIFSGHLLLAWQEGPWLYVVSVHTSNPRSAPLRMALARVAAGCAPTPRRPEQPSTAFAPKGDLWRPGSMFSPTSGSSPSSTPMSKREHQ